MRVTRELLNLVHDAERRTRVSLLGSEHQADAFARDIPSMTRAESGLRSRVVAEAAVKKSLHLRGQTIPIHRRAEDNALSGNEILEKERAKPILDGFTAGQTTRATVTQKTRDEIINKTD
jgi:hypothetical protein